MSDTTSENLIKNALQPVFQKYSEKVILAYLFGSVAQHSSSLLSDLDIAVFLSSDAKYKYFDTKLSLYADFCRILKRNDIDVIVLNSSTNILLLDDIVRSGEVLFDSNRDLREEFELKVIHSSIDFKEQRLAVMGH
ncbi:MAG: nucleotidyltransferase domain-containing protein [Nitrospirae bacterium]|nr:nucleotidyltransferase domain-containing protein [Nitrospirota bacterium]